MEAIKPPSSAIPDQKTTLEIPNPYLVPLNKIIPDPKQTRKEFPEGEIKALADSIALNGLITPILVVATGKNEESYKLVDGERRYRAFRALQAKNKDSNKYDSITVVIIQDDKPISGILANMARKIYNPMESAEALKFIKNHDKLTDEQLAKLVEKSRSSVTEYLSLTSLPEDIKDKAKAESFVPFRVLKKLATENISDEEKIFKYNDLHKKYKPSEKKERKKSENPKSPWTADRIAQAFQKKITSITSEFDKFRINEISNKEYKENLKKSLQTLQEKINIINDELNKNAE